jgi:hypothetical protein
MKIDTNIKAGRIADGPNLPNHDQTVARCLGVKSNVRAGRITDGPTIPYHNQTVARALKA